MEFSAMIEHVVNVATFFKGSSMQLEAVEVGGLILRWLHWSPSLFIKFLLLRLDFYHCFQSAVPKKSVLVSPMECVWHCWSVWRMNKLNSNLAWSPLHLSYNVSLHSVLFPLSFPRDVNLVGVHSYPELSLNVHDADHLTDCNFPLHNNAHIFYACASLP